MQPWKVFPRQINTSQNSWLLSVLGEKKKKGLFLSKIQIQDPVSVHTVSVKGLPTACCQREDTGGNSLWYGKYDKKGWIESTVSTPSSPLLAPVQTLSELELLTNFLPPLWLITFPSPFNLLVSKVSCANQFSNSLTRYEKYSLLLF